MTIYALISLGLLGVSQSMKESNHTSSESARTSSTTNVGASTTYLMFMMQWKPDVCSSTKTYHDKDCEDASVPNITIHGIWPEYYEEHDGYFWPQYCGSSTRPDLTFDDIVDANELDTVWPSLYETSFNYKFWEHEWDKHGTCWTFVEPKEYFLYALKWYKEYDNIQEILAKSNIYPSNTKMYSKMDTTHALSNGFGADMVLRCDATGKYIEEFVFCRDWYGNKMDCPKELLSGCDSNGVILMSTPQLQDENALAIPVKVDSHKSGIFKVFLVVIALISLVALYVLVSKCKACKEVMRGYNIIENKKKTMQHHALIV